MQAKIASLEQKAVVIRRRIIEMLGAAGSGHPGGSLSAADLVTALFFHEMQLDPRQPDWPGRDVFVLSKGHAAPVLYAALAERGFFPVEELATLRQLGSRLQGHPDRNKLPGVEVSTGSLGQGLSVANGMALAARLDSRPSRFYVLMGDGELEEGQVWEAAMAANHYRIDNLVVMVDHNGYQIDGAITDILSPEPVVAKWEAFGWHVMSINGHDMAAILDALHRARDVKGQPVAIIAETIKGKGISFMENQVNWHGVAPKPDEVTRALAELQ